MSAAYVHVYFRLDFIMDRVPTVREKSVKNEKSSRSGNFELSQGNLKFWKKSGKSQGIL